MAAINPSRISTALTVLAIGMFALVAIRWVRKPKQRAEKGKRRDHEATLGVVRMREQSCMKRAISASVRAGFEAEEANRHAHL